MSDTAEGLFTQKQKEYVSGIKDDDLRAVLLHQVRLRDNISNDRDAFERRCNELTEQVIKLKAYSEVLEQRSDVLTEQVVVYAKELLKQQEK